HDMIASAVLVYCVRYFSLLCDDLLRAQRQFDRLLSRKGQRFVHRIGMERLRAAEDGRKRLQRRSHHVVHRLLSSKRTSCGLRMAAQLERSWILRMKPPLHLARPQTPRGPKLRDLLEELVVHVEE